MKKISLLMKKISLLIYLSTLALCANAVTSTSGTFISADGKWGTAADWESGAVLALPDEVTTSETGKGILVTNITFAPTDTTADTVSMLVNRPSSTKNVTVNPTIDVSKIKTLNLYAKNTSDGFATIFNLENFHRASGDTTTNYTVNLYSDGNDNMYRNKIGISGKIHVGTTVNVCLPISALYDGTIEGKLVIDSKITKGSSNIGMNGSHESSIVRAVGDKGG